MSQSRNLLEGLEMRTLFAALTINGTNAPDTINITQSGNTLNVSLNSVISTYNAADYTDIVVNGLSGADAIVADNSVQKPMSIYGGFGNDTMNGGAGNDSLFGEHGDDFMDGRMGNDVMSGGQNADTADYSDRTQNLTITLDDIQNDGYGSPGGDNVKADVENVIGGSGNDRFTGNGSNNKFEGRDGNDTLEGAGGNDTCIGGNGNDLVDGGVAGNANYGQNTGVDSLLGGPGNDVLFSPENGYAYAYGDGDRDWFKGYGGADKFFGGAGDDTMFSGDGNDSLEGGTGNDDLHAEGGNDFARGNGGSLNYGQTDNDTVDGGAGNDTLHGDQGNDSVTGGAGNDNLYGGSGNDSLFGGANNDTLITIGGGQQDNAKGEGGADSFWVDSESSEKIDADIGEIFAGAVHRVGGFEKLKTQSGNMLEQQNVSRDLNGQELLDPLDGRNNRVDFSNRPLFSTNGPRMDDVNQGQAGTCYFLAPLSGIAKNNPYRIRQSVVDLGDGTYAVQFKRGGQNYFYRVDADLRTYGGTSPYYASFGAQDSIWVPILEKALTFHMYGKGTYDSISFDMVSWGYSVFGATSSVIDKAGTGGNSWLKKIDDAMKLGQTVSLVTPDELNTNYGGWDKVMSDHVYVVDHVNFTGGNATSITFRNPWGYDGGAAQSGDTTDGYVTLSASAAWLNFTSAIGGAVL